MYNCSLSLANLPLVKHEWDTSATSPFLACLPDEHHRTGAMAKHFGLEHEAGAAGGEAEVRNS